MNMKRLIKYWNTYESDKNNFSNVSTNFEVLPIIVDDTASNKELRTLAKELGLETQGNVASFEGGKLTHSLKLKEVKTKERWGKIESMQCYIGFIKVDDTLPVLESINNDMTAEQAIEIINNQAYGIRDAITINGESMVLIDSWDAFSALSFAGYSLEAFAKHYDCLDSQGKAETVFDDSVFQCGECGEWDYNDNGYTYNYRIIGHEIIGERCGCLHEVQKRMVDEYIDDSSQAIELDTAKELESENKLEHLERFIGGMVDGRGGYYDGKYTRESNPEKALDEYREKFPDSQFIFSHDESGQFQTYFSIWKVL